MKALRLLVVSAALISVFAVTPVMARGRGKESGKLAIAPDIDRNALWDGRKAVEFHALTAPKMVKAKDAKFLIEDEYVLGITRNGESRAYPTRNSSPGTTSLTIEFGRDASGAPSYVTITFCIVCNSGMRFDTPMVNARPLTFDFYGLYNGVMAMFDAQTKSVWLQVSGRAIAGPMRDTKLLKCGALLDTTWGQWKRLHPNTLVMAPDPHFKDCYEPKGSIMVRGYDRFPAPYFRKTVTHRNSRLPMSSRSLPSPCREGETGAAEGTRSHALYRAYPVKGFKGKTSVVNDRVGATPIAVLFLARSETMCAVEPVVAGPDAHSDGSQGSAWRRRLLR